MALALIELTDSWRMQSTRSVHWDKYLQLSENRHLLACWSFPRSPGQMCICTLWGHRYFPLDYWQPALSIPTHNITPPIHPCMFSRYWTVIVPFDPPKRSWDKWTRDYYPQFTWGNWGAKREDLRQIIKSMPGPHQHLTSMTCPLA